MRQRSFASTIGASALVALGFVAGTSQIEAQAVSFTPPDDNTAPRASTGGASRSSFFVPPTENSAPRSSTGGASRDSFFVPPAENGAPKITTGAASRDSFFAPPADQAASRDLTSGASQGLAESVDTVAVSTGHLETSGVPIAAAADSMRALLPDSFYGKTLEARPTILVYIPPSNAYSAVFSLKNEAKDTLYETTLLVPETGGVISVQIPDEAPELAIAQNYQWYVALEIDGALAPASPFVEGWVRRIAPSSQLAQTLSQSDELSRVAALGASGIWYDTAAQLASLQVAQENDVLSDHWTELLESVGLADIAAAPIVR